MHHFGRFEESALRAHPTFEGHSEGYRCASLVDHTSGSVHTGLSMNELEPGGAIHPHVHSFEEGFYILSGEAVVRVVLAHRCSFAVSLRGDAAPNPQARR